MLAAHNFTLSNIIMRHKGKCTCEKSVCECLSRITNAKFVAQVVKPCYVVTNQLKFSYVQDLNTLSAAMEH